MQLRYSTPVYKIQAKVMVNGSKAGSPLSTEQSAFGGGFGTLLGGPSSVDNEAEIIKTRYLMEQVISDLNEQVTIFRPGTVRDVEVYPNPLDIKLLSRKDSVRGGVFTVEILSKTGGQIFQNESFSVDFTFGQIIDLPRIGQVIINRTELTDKDSQQTYKVRIAEFDSRVSNFIGRLGVSIKNNLVSVIDLSFDYPLRNRGEEILNKVIEVYMENDLIHKNIIADSTIAFVDNRLGIVEKELDAIEQEIQSFRQHENLADMSTQAQILLENSSVYVNQLSEVQTQLNILADIEEYLNDETNQRVLPNAVSTNDVVFNDLITRYNEVLLERGRRLLSATPNNPTIINLDQQLSTLRHDMLANLRSTQSRLNITKSDIERKTRELESEVKHVPATERIFLDLSRQQQIKHELYLYLLQKREETAISKTATVSNSRIIDPPKAAASPFSPKRTATLLAGLLIGLIIPSALIYFQDVLNTKLQNRTDIKKQTSTPIIGEIIRSRHKEPLVVSKHSRSAIAEQFRTLRTNLAFYLTDPKQKTILLTSSMSGEGKSFVALNLATILAMTGKKVVLMEMDLRKPNLSEKLNHANKIGFTNYVLNTKLMPGEIYAASGIHENLLLIGSGPIPPNPAETILSHRLDELMEHLTDHFDYVIIDAPPIGLVTDAQLLSRHADLTLYLVRLGYTHKAQLQIVEDLYRNQKMSQLAILVNDIDPKGGYGYGYGSSYGYGYYEDENKQPWWKFWAKS
ncbi:tyrosine protein kinase [Parapedobacter pyrenivorans]|uniref:Tyrosine protein kinase n=2 Tax=Parapedobacter pyrenivorans TaxID=1305674 RepID=A0A917HLN5_9SPHI|nr:tyrosine protein kinase [Parapedobacter pyrenivorans]